MSDDQASALQVFLRLQPVSGCAGSLFEVNAREGNVTLLPPGEGESKIDASSPATAMKLTFGLGHTPSKIPYVVWLLRL